MADTETAIANHRDDDGLPDLVVPMAALAWALDAKKVARRWLAAVRRSPKPTANFLVTIIYRQLRDTLGILDENPLDNTSVEDIYTEARTWLMNL